MNKKDKQNIFTQYQVESPIATELRRLYNNLKRRSDDSPHQSFLITSSMRGEGKSTISSYLAMTIAQFPRKKVLLVDADLRRPRMHKVFGVENNGGLAECLRDSLDPMTMVQKTELPNLDLITCGRATESPSQLFESEMLSEFFAKVQFYYDIVLVDSAPVLAVSDTLFLCRELQGVLFVVIAGITPREVALRAKQVLVDAHANIVGAVVNNVSEVLPYYYDYKYYGAYKEMKASE